MKQPSDFKFYVAVTPQQQVSVVALCPECGSSISATDCSGNFGSGNGLAINGMLQNHTCHQSIVSVPK